MPSNEIRELAGELAGDGVARLRRRQAVVQSVQTGSVTIRLGASTVDITGVRYLASYSPVAGDTVWVLVDGPDLLIFGRVATTNQGVVGVRYVVPWTGANNEPYSAGAQVTGLTQSITVPAGRRYRVIVTALLINDVNAGRIIGTTLWAGAVIGRWCDWTAAASAVLKVENAAYWSPAAGTYTVSANLAKNTGAGTVGINNGAGCNLVIEDVGPAANA